MDIEEFRDFCLSMDGVTEKTPFGKFANMFESILLFYILDHMFCIIDINDFSFVNIKSTPEEIKEIQMSHASTGNPTNRSLKHWIRLDFNGDIPDLKIYELVKHAYDIVRQHYALGKH